MRIKIAFTETRDIPGAMVAVVEEGVGANCEISWGCLIELDIEIRDCGHFRDLEGALDLRL